jgi:NarL family two-component system response regulator LiaR
MTQETSFGKKIRLLTVDDHVVVRKGLSMMLATEEDITLVGEASNGLEAVELARCLNPDVIIMDLIMPQKDGIGAIQEIIAENPNARILVLSSFAEDGNIIPALKAGALGYLLKDSSPHELLKAIRDISLGKSSLSPVVASKLIRKFQTDKTPVKSKQEKPLTDREVEVIELIAEGCSNKEIAEKLCLSKTTIRFHVSNIFSKLNLTNRTQAGLYAIKNGLSGRNH